MARTEKKNKTEKKKECPHCNYNCPIKHYKKHLKVCDENPKNKNYKSIKGLGGWMIIPIINLYVVGIISVVLMIIYFLFTKESIDILLGFSSAIMVVLTIQTLLLMHAHSKKFPNLFIWWLWVGLGLSLIESFLLNDYTFVGGEIIFNIIWTNYILKSKRVKNTFIC